MESKLLKQEQVKYSNALYYIHQTTYIDGKPAIVLDKKKEFEYDFECIVASTNLEDTEYDQVAILSDEIFELLVDEGIIKYHGFLGSGYNTYYCGKLLA